MRRDDADALGRLLDDKINSALGQWTASPPNAGNTGADAGASPRLAERQAPSTAGISTSRPLLPLPTIESCEPHCHASSARECVYVVGSLLGEREQAARVC